MMQDRKTGTSMWVLILFSASFTLPGCAKPPLQQLSEARSAIERARAERADLYAPESFLKAEKLLHRAEEEKDAGKNKDAKGHSVNARKRAERTLELSVPKKEAAKAGAEDVIEEAQVYFEKAEKQDAGSLAPDWMERAGRAFGESEEAFAAEDFFLSAERASTAVVDLEDALRICAEKAARRAEEEARKAAVPKLPGTHTVKGRESLWDISGYPDVYNDPLMWRLIYTANRDQIKDWGSIYPGQVLTIPREATPEQVMEARRLAGASPPFTPPDEANRPY